MFLRQPLTMEQKLGKNSIDIEALRKFVTDYPACLDGRPSQTTIKAMIPSRLLRGDQGTQMPVPTTGVALWYNKRT